MFCFFFFDAGCNGFMTLAASKIVIPKPEIVFRPKSWGKVKKPPHPKNAGRGDFFASLKDGVIIGFLESIWPARFFSKKTTPQA